MGNGTGNGMLEVDEAIRRIRSSDAAGMWMRTYLDQWVEVRKPPRDGKISVTVHADTSYRLERRSLSQVEGMIGGGYWVAFSRLPVGTDGTRVDAAVLRRQELTKVVKARGLMAKALDAMGVPELRDRLLSLPEDGLTRESMMAAIADIAVSFGDSGGEPASKETGLGSPP